MRLPRLQTAAAFALSLGLLSSASAAPAVGVLLKARSSFWNAVEKGALETVPEKTYCDFVIVTKDSLNEPKIQALLE